MGMIRVECPWWSWMTGAAVTTAVTTAMMAMRTALMSGRAARACTPCAAGVVLVAAEAAGAPVLAATLQVGASRAPRRPATGTQPMTTEIQFLYLSLAIPAPSTTRIKSLWAGELPPMHRGRPPASPDLPASPDPSPSPGVQALFSEDRSRSYQAPAEVFASAEAAGSASERARAHREASFTR